MPNPIQQVEFDQNSVTWTQILTSSNLEMVAHSGNTMHVVFSDRKFVYHYAPVSAKKFEEFMNAESRGSWIHANLRNNAKIAVAKSVFIDI